MTLGTSLPAWLYSDPGFFELEAATLFRRTWQLVCHLSDVPQAGDFHTLDLLGERVVTIRGADGQARSFHNVCRHRAARLAEGASGNCGHRLVCPYHAWSYGLDGRLASTPKWQGFGALDPVEHGLKPVEQEVWRGFVFVRFEAGLPSVAEMMAPYAQELAPYRLEDVVPQGRVTLRPRDVNWKNVADNYGDALHIPVAHPGLTRLFGPSYAIEAQPWVDKMWGVVGDGEGMAWSERGYAKLMDGFDHVPEADRRVWRYYRLWPNTALDIYPDQMDFMQFIPVSPTRTMIREIAYALPDARRETKAARYLNWRVNREVNAEDTVLIEGVQAGMASSSYVAGPLGPSEVCLAAFADRLRAAIPEAESDRPVRRAA